MRYEHARVVHGYHGCDARVAKRLLDGEPFVSSENDYDWLGSGVYFWEFGPDRAMRFALENRSGLVTTPAVVGAVIQLGNCFDLLDTRFTDDLRKAFPAFRRDLRTAGSAMPSNKGDRPDRKQRKLDCAVLNWYFRTAEKTMGEDGRYDTVRGCFREGTPVFRGSGIYEQSHIQIAVRNPACILGVFRPAARTEAAGPFARAFPDR